MFCYILHSPSLDQFYIGITTQSVQERLLKHNNAYYGYAFTSKTRDWIIFLEFECQCLSQMTQIEKHIKRMKSRVYINNLKKYPEIIDKLKTKYHCQ